MSSIEKSLGEVSGQLKMVIELIKRYSDKGDESSKDIVDLKRHCNELDRRLDSFEDRCEEVQKKLNVYLEKVNQEKIDKLEKSKTNIVKVILNFMSGIWQILSAILIAYLLYRLHLST